MGEVIKLLQHHATNEEGYDTTKRHDKHITIQYKNSKGQEGIQKLNLKIRNPDKV